MSNKRLNMLNVKEVAELFGVNPMTIYRKVNRGEIPAIKFGKSWLFPEDEIKGWIKAQLNRPSGSSGKNIQLTDGLKRSDFKNVREIRLIYLFGSASLNLNSPLSDIDIAYLDDSSISPFDLEPKVEDAIRNSVPNLPRIDLVRLNDAPVTIQYKAINEGELIYRSSEEARANFEEIVVERYLDYSPIIEQFYKTSYKEVA